MIAEELRTMAMNKLGASEDIKWEDHVCFSVAKKMFMVITPDHIPVSASFKVDIETFETVISKPGFSKHKYLGRYHWVQLDNINRLSRKEWDEFINLTYSLVVEKLSSKTRKNLEGLISS